jgi:hypothetical protein
MRLRAKFMRAMEADAEEVVRAFLTLGVITVLSLRMDLFRIARIIAARYPRRALPCHDSRIEAQIALAVRAAGMIVPFSTCGTRALTMIALLARRNQAAHLRIGIHRQTKGRFSAHAWVVNDIGQVISEPEHQVGRHMHVQVTDSF